MWLFSTYLYTFSTLLLANCILYFDFDKKVKLNIPKVLPAQLVMEQIKNETCQQMARNKICKQGWRTTSTNKLMTMFTQL